MPEQPNGRPENKTTVDEHAALISSLVRLAPGKETVPLADALGRVTASDVLSPVDLPLFRNSQMDGFAVVAADLPGDLEIVGEIAARPGTPPPLSRGTAVRIMTGAPVPEGADAVVPVEDVTVSDKTVSIPAPRTTGEFVRERGSDLKAGDRLVSAGTRLAARHLAALAASGITEVEVNAKIRVGIITTGAELVSPGELPRPGQIHDANAVALTALVTSAGADVSIAEQVSDDHAAMSAALDRALKEADLIITSGGISMGDYEVVREVLEPLGATVTTIAMQPGGPQATAIIDGVPVICFPGNPVSTQLSFEIFLAPILRKAAGLPEPARAQRILQQDIRSVPGKRQFLRGRALPEDQVAVVGGASSHLVAGLAASDLLIDIPADVTELKKGDTVETRAL